MRKAILFLLILPLGLVAQNITNTLGASGVFTVEDNSNNSIIHAQRPTPATQRIIFGDYSSTFILPSGTDAAFIHNEGTERVNIIVGKGSAFSSFPKLQLLYSRNDLNNIGGGVLLDGEFLGVINFGGYHDGNWRESLGSIDVTVTGTPGPTISVPTTMKFTTTKTNGVSNTMRFDNNGALFIPGLIASSPNTTNFALPTPLQFQTTQSNGLTLNTMTFDNVGNLTVPGAVTSQAIRLLNGTANILSTDQTIVFDAASTFTLPLISSVPVGKTYTFKKIDNGNFTFTIQGNGANIDGAGSQTSGGNNNRTFVTIQSDGTNWWVISEGSGL